MNLVGYGPGPAGTGSMDDPLGGGVLQGQLSAMPPPADDEPESLDEDGEESPVDRLRRWADPRQSPNLIEEILEMPNGASTIQTIGERSVREYDIDEKSRSHWVKWYDRGIKLANQIADQKTTPWPGASNIVYPLVAEATLQFAARAYPEIVKGSDVVKGTTVGDDTGVPKMGDNGQPAIDPQTGQPVWESQPGENAQRARRVGEHMSYQLLHEQPEWEEETDRLVHTLPVVGCCFRKSYFDNVDGRNYSVLVNGKNLCVNYTARSLPTAPRITEIFELYPHEIKELERTGTFIEVTYGPNEGESPDDYDAPRTFIEQHRRWDLDDDGYPEPYIVTIHKLTRRVVRIVANFEADEIKTGKDGEIIKIEPIQYYTKYDFLPSFDGGIYGIGFALLLGPLNEAINTALNQIFDAGTLQNTGGGFVGRGLSPTAGAMRFKLGEWKVVNAPGGAIRDAIVPLQFPGPSPVLFQLLSLLIQIGKELGAHADVLTGNQTRANQPAATTLALIEQGMKVYNAIFKRIYRSLKGEFDKLYRLNGIYLDEEVGYQRGNEWRKLSRGDYLKGSGVVPVADPQMTTGMQQLAQAEFLRQFATDPFLDQKAVRMRILTAARIDKPEELVKQNQSPDPAFVLRAEELRQKDVLMRAQGIKAMADAVGALAGAEKAAAEAGSAKAGMHLAFLEHHLNVIKTTLEAMGNASGDEGGPGAGAAAGGQQPGLPGDIAGQLQGLAQAAAGGASPPVPGGAFGGGGGFGAGAMA